LVVPETKYRARQRLDPFGALMLAGGVGFALLYLSNGANVGWTDPLYLGYLGIGLLLLLAFVVVERQVAEPIINMRLLFSPNVSNVLFLAFFASIVVGVQAYAIPYMGLSYTHNQLVQQATAPFHGLIPAREVKVIGGAGYALGLTLLGLAFHVQVWGSSVGMLSGAASGELSGRRGARTPLLVSMFCFAASSWIYVGDHSGWVTLAVIGVVFGVGFGGYYATTPNLLVEASPPSQQGITAGMLGVANSIGTAVGTAIAAAFQAANPLKLAVGTNVSLVGTPLPGTHVVPRAEEFADKAYTGMFIACAIAGTIAFVCALLLKSGRTPSTGGLGYLAGEPAEQVPAVSL
jgi:MFS family permease